MAEKKQKRKRDSDDHRKEKKQKIQEVFVKILADDLVHHGFQYKEGLNIDTVPFNASGKCRPGGLYFCRADNVYDYFDFGNKIADVEIPDDAKVYDEGDKLKADRIIIRNIRPIADHPMFADKKFTEEEIIREPQLLKCIKEPSEELCLAVVKQYGKYIIYIKDPSEEVCLAVVNNDPYAIEYIKDPSEKVCLAAVKQNVYAFQYIKDPSEKVCRLAIKLYPEIKFRDIPTKYRYLIPGYKN